MRAYPGDPKANKKNESPRAPPRPPQRPQRDPESFPPNYGGPAGGFLKCLRCSPCPPGASAACWGPSGSQKNAGIRQQPPRDTPEAPPEQTRAPQEPRRRSQEAPIHSHKAPGGVLRRACCALRARLEPPAGLPGSPKAATTPTQGTTRATPRPTGGPRERH